MYERSAKQNGFVLVSAIFSYAGEMHKGIKRLFLEQIRLTLQLVGGEVQESKVQPIMKHLLGMSNFCSNQ